MGKEEVLAAIKAKREALENKGKKGEGKKQTRTNNAPPPMPITGISINRGKFRELLKEKSNNGLSNSEDSHYIKILWGRYIKLRKNGGAPRDQAIIDYVLRFLEDYGSEIITH